MIYYAIFEKNSILSDAALKLLVFVEILNEFSKKFESEADLDIAGR